MSRTTGRPSRRRQCKTLGPGIIATGGRPSLSVPTLNVTTAHGRLIPAR
jgi:hypothetical protein